MNDSTATDNKTDFYTNDSKILSSMPKRIKMNLRCVCHIHYCCNIK